MMIGFIISFSVFNVMMKLTCILILGLMVAKVVENCLQ